MPRGAIASRCTRLTAARALIAAALTLAAAIATLSPLAAHHAASSVYDTNRTIDLAGAIESVVFRNPHSLLTLKTTGGVSWQIEMGPPSQLARSGWTPETLKPGLKIRVSGQPARDARLRQLCCPKIVRFDGSEIARPAYLPSPGSLRGSSE
jgi:hypothetical protein